MAEYTVLVMAEVEPYRTILPMIEQKCRVVRWRPDDDAWRGELADVDGIYVYAHIKISPELMDSIPKLKVIAATRIKSGQIVISPQKKSRRNANCSQSSPNRRKTFSN